MVVNPLSVSSAVSRTWLEKFKKWENITAESIFIFIFSGWHFFVFALGLGRHLSELCAKGALPLGRTFQGMKTLIGLNYMQGDLLCWLGERKSYTTWNKKGKSSKVEITKSVFFSVFVVRGQEGKCQEFGSQHLFGFTLTTDTNSRVESSCGRSPWASHDRLDSLVVYPCECGMG